MQSEAMDKLLRLAAEIPAGLDKLMSDAGVERKTQPGWQNISAVNLTTPMFKASLPRKLPPR